MSTPDSNAYTPVGTITDPAKARRQKYCCGATIIAAIIVIALLSVVVSRTNVFTDHSANWILYTPEVPLGTASKAAFVSWTNNNVLYKFAVDESTIDLNTNTATFYNAGEVVLTATYQLVTGKCPANALTSPVWLFVSPFDAPATNVDSLMLCFV